MNDAVSAMVLILRRMFRFMLPPAPTTEHEADVLRLGACAFEAGQPIGARPFKGRTGNLWLRGWHDAWKRDTARAGEAVRRPTLPERSISVVVVEDGELRPQNACRTSLLGPARQPQPDHARHDQQGAGDAPDAG